jgi:hypothetical protein
MSKNLSEYITELNGGEPLKIDIDKINKEFDKAYEKSGYAHPIKDSVNHPPHYNKGKVECIDAIESAVSDLHGIEAVCTANAIKYLYRWKAKDGVESLKKARWYLDRLINTLEDE